MQSSNADTSSSNAASSRTDEKQTINLELTPKGKDLFPLIESVLPLSRFVNTTLNSLPDLLNQALDWQIHHLTADQLSLEKSLQQGLLDYLQIDHPADKLDEAVFMSRLRCFRRAHSAAIAILELNDKMTLDVSSRRISQLADCLIRQAYDWSFNTLIERFGKPIGRESGELQSMLILAMGKLGGGELNFSSDIDLIFFYPEDGTTCDAPRNMDNSRFFRRLSMLLIKVLDEVTQDGFVFRVDMRLRPYGDSGALAMSLAQAEEYYQEQGREWERFAMIRARLLTGKHEHQKQLTDIIRPFSFRRYIDYGVIESIRNMKEMIQREVRRKGLKDNIKLGAGGIREIEFIVQSLQLIQGGRDKRLQEKNLFLVMPLLVESKLLTATVADELVESYLFLRKMEHCIQEYDEKQTQQLPQSTQEQAALLQAMHFANWQVLLDTLQHHTQRVNQHFNELLGSQRADALSQDEFYVSLAEGHIEPTALQQKLKEDKQLEIAELTATEFVALVNRFLSDSAVSSLSARGARRLKTFFPALLAICLVTDDPVKTLDCLLKVLQSILKRTAYLELLSENPPILQHLVDLAGRSQWIVQRLSEYPILFDELLYPSSLYEPLEKADLRAELQQSLLRVDNEDEELLLDTLRTFKQVNELRVAAALLAERMSISQVSRYLTQIAEVVLQASVDLCWRMLVKKHGAPQSLDGGQDKGFAVIGYGKLGGLELGFGSDLDLVFLFNQPIDEATTGPKPVGNSRFYTRLAQKLIHFLSTRTNSGVLYEVDMRLRPSGSSGLLVSHIDAYQEYQQESAWTWEHQALVRARLVAGDKSMIEPFNQIRTNVLSKKRDIQRLQQDVIAMRDKMRQQLERHQQGKVDLKQTAGGMVDIEFLAQYFVLAYLGKEQVPQNMVDCLKLAQAHRLIDAADALTLIRNYRLFRNKLNEINLVTPKQLADYKEFVDPLSQVNNIWHQVLCSK
ncbi:bifunctional [glutamate--ammonia ligase]-adenylyl-L-tyrosine phosphorylase/[glutamate--ammonia-ligase] adenylyltransferase [Aliikangiella maris]|uniref:Bifunctional [glutamate--ammonia ligase]-adenylyl-L-tyrosine phosphorylase/[glutamate--ammonia-ligase] adenylyltransferase n=2 Tax=Aliikangiella maris TaxID=3162458 RepID=A0ABV2BRP8_9GAMM